MEKIPNLFFEFAFVKRQGESFRISGASTVSGMEETYAHRYAQEVIARLGTGERRIPVMLCQEMPGSVRTAAGDAFAEHRESYALVVTGDSVTLYSPSTRGMLYAVSTLMQLLEADALCEMVLFDYPDTDIRGYRVYTPGADSFDAFKDMVDMLIYYKYNSIIIEVGGAMEYKRHPEINEKWVEFCAEVHKSPYESHRIQFETHPQWQKNSIHADNGAGSFISQEQMRELIAYCRERELEVIPEVPTLSHSDYIVMAHPDIRERAEDTYPDTYCPSNPKSYELAFDVLEEVIEVFQPRHVNIGHDECYTLAKCPLCRDKDPVELYVQDIIKINDFLKARGIKALMWGEKLIDNVYLPEDGAMRGFGGTGEPAWDIPRLIGCVGKIPTDVTLLHWYWSLCEADQEENLKSLGYSMIFGNFHAGNLKDYRSRMARVSGGFVSNWGAFEPEYMQRNGQNFALLTTAWIFWNRDYDSHRQTEVKQMVKQALYARFKRTLGENILELFQTTSHFRPYKAFYDGYYIVPEDWEIGKHILTYTDGTQAELPIVYGYNIRTAAEIDSSDSGSAEAKTTGFVEVTGASCPTVLEGKMFYKAAYANPFPEKQIESIRCQPNDGIQIEVRYR